MLFNPVGVIDLGQAFGMVFGWQEKKLEQEEREGETMVQRTRTEKPI